MRCENTLEFLKKFKMKVLIFLIYMSLAAYASANDSFGPAIKLNPPLMTGSSLFSGITIAPDSQRVVFTARISANSPAQLYSASISGGDTRLLTPNLMPGNDVLSGNGEPPLISADSANVVYRADQITDNVVELFSVPIQGGEQKRLNDDLLSNNRIPEEFSISSDNARVIYAAQQNTSGQSELFSVPLGGGVPVRLNADLPGGGDVIARNAQISPNGSHVVYAADQNTNNIREIFSVPIEGGAITRLNDDLVEGGDVLDGSDNFQISSDSKRVVYLADSRQDDVLELFSVPIGGGTNTRLNPDLVRNGNVRNFIISPDGQYVIYRADQNKDNQFELFSVPITGGDAVRLNGDLVNGGDVDFDFQISADSQYVIYLADQNRDELFELFSVPIVGGAATRLNPDLVSQGDVLDFDFSPDGNYIVYRALQDNRNQSELFSVEVLSERLDEICFPIKSKANKAIVVCL